MPKNIVIFSDGTGQDGGVRPDQTLSNVYKIYRAARVGPDGGVDPARQVAFYDPGLGTEDDVHGFGRVWRTAGKFLASVAGRGIGTNIVDCYEFILNHWRPGDRIYLVGFSRGAYTARCVSQVLSLCGVPTHEARRPGEPFRRFARSTRRAAERAVHEVYEHGAGHPIAEFEAERDEQARRFRADYGSGIGEISNAYPYFVGVFDTVAALGAAGWKYWALVAMFAAAGLGLISAAAGMAHALVGAGFFRTALMVSASAALVALILTRRGSRREIRDYPGVGDRRVHHVRWRAKDYDRGLSGYVAFARHAKAIDEDRADFPHVPWGNPRVVRRHVEGEVEPMVQLWFAGNHSDVGGSYPEVESRLSDVSLRWMVEEAASLPEPLLFDHSRLGLWPDPHGMQHSEVQSLRDRLGWMPRWTPAWLRNGWGEATRNAAGGILHPSVHARLSGPDVVQGTGFGPYRPASLCEDGRFGHLYGGAPPSVSVAMEDAARWPLGIGDRDLLTLAEQAPVLAGCIEGRGVTRADLLAATDPSAPWDAYAVALRLRELDRALAASGRTADPVTALVGDARREVGRLVYGCDPEEGRGLARDVGIGWLVQVDRDGSGVVMPTWDRSAVEAEAVT